MTNPEELDFITRNELIKIDEDTYEGKYPLKFLLPTSRGVYGGDFMSQAILAAWKTVEDKELSPHSLHTYFLRAGSNKTPMIWKISRNNDGRNFANRHVECYQKGTNKLCISMGISFTRNNSSEKKKEIYRQNKEKNIPIGFQKPPQFYFEKYKDTLKGVEGNGIEKDAKFFMPDEFFEDKPINPETSPALSNFGFFFRFEDDWRKSNEPQHIKTAQVAYGSDSLWLMTLPHTFGRRFSPMKEFFSVSLDHSMYFHDTNFDPHDWLYVEYNFSRLANDRVLANCQIYNSEGVEVVSFNQEALVFFPNEFVDKYARNYKL